jgi:hypothetical protein
MRVALSVISGAAIFENVFFIMLVVDKGVLSPVGNVFAIISSVVAFIYALAILVYLFKGRQDGSLLEPLTIFGIGQGIMITTLRIIFFVRVLQLS